MNYSSILKGAGINHSFMSNIKARKIINPNSEMIRRIVISTGCNGHWLLTGEGEMFIEEEDRQNPMYDSAVSHLINAHQLMDGLVSKKGGSKEPQLPVDLELELARLLVRLLEDRQKSRDPD